MTRDRFIELNTLVSALSHWRQTVVARLTIKSDLQIKTPQLGKHKERRYNKKSQQNTLI